LQITGRLRSRELDVDRLDRGACAGGDLIMRRELDAELQRGLLDRA